MRQLPLPIEHRQFLELSVAAPYVQVIPVDCPAEQPIAGDGHGGAVDVGSDIEDTNLS